MYDHLVESVIEGIPHVSGLPGPTLRQRSLLLIEPSWQMVVSFELATVVDEILHFLLLEILSDFGA